MLRVPFRHLEVYQLVLNNMQFLPTSVDLAEQIDQINSQLGIIPLQ